MASSDLKRKAITENLEQAQSGSDVEAVSEPLLGHGRTKGSKNLRCKLDDARARECLMEEYGRKSAPDDESASTAFSALNEGDRSVLVEMYKVLNWKQFADKRKVPASEMRERLRNLFPELVRSHLQHWHTAIEDKE